MVALGYEGKLGHLRWVLLDLPNPRPLLFLSLAEFSHLRRIEVYILGTAMFIPRDSRLVIETLFYIQGRQFILRQENSILVFFLGGGSGGREGQEKRGKGGRQGKRRIRVRP